MQPISTNATKIFRNFMIWKFKKNLFKMIHFWHFCISPKKIWSPKVYIPETKWWIFVWSFDCKIKKEIWILMNYYVGIEINIQMKLPKCWHQSAFHFWKNTAAYNAECGISLLMNCDIIKNSPQCKQSYWMLSYSHPFEKKKRFRSSSDISGFQNDDSFIEFTEETITNRSRVFLI